MRRDEMGVDHEELEAEFKWWAQFGDRWEVAANKGEVAATHDGGENGGH